MSKNRTLEISSLMGSSTNENIPLDLTEIEQSLNLWSELFPMIEKEILTLTNVAQEMQECSGKDGPTDRSITYEEGKKGIERISSLFLMFLFLPSESEKYVDALMKIAARINDVEEKATTCIKEARQQLKKVRKRFRFSVTMFSFVQDTNDRWQT